jgi:4,4'-diaponeurosporenoate glycosyltransferase
VVVPARNEAPSLPLLLGDLGQQSAPPDQIVVVDDSSADATAAVARSFGGVTVVDGEPLPTGWTGKTWACWQGAARTAGDVIVFLDADVRLGPDAIAAVVAEQSRRGGLLSVQPLHRPERVYEQASAMFNLVATMGVGAASPGRDGAARGAFGPCLACRRTDYLALDGHRSVRGEIIEDMALAQHFATASQPVSVLSGGDQVSYRMYGGGFRQLIEGWSKNMAAGAGSLALGRAALIAGWVTALLVSVQQVGEAAIDRSTATVLVASLVVVAFVAQQHAMLRQVGRFRWWTALLYPITTALFVVVFLRSLWITVVRRRVTWRGRTIALGADAPSVQPPGGR